MRELKSVLFYLMVNIRYTFIIFWIILTTIYALSIVLSLFMESTSILFQPYIPIYIFSMVIGMWTVKNALPYLLKMGITRKVMYGTIWIYFLLFAMVNTVLAHVFTFISRIIGKEQIAGNFTLSNGEAEVEFDFIHMAQFMPNDTWMNQMMIDFIICFLALTCMFMIGLIFYQFGQLGGFVFIGILFALFLGIIATNRIEPIFIYIYNHYTMTLYYQAFFIGIVLYLLTYIILRRLTLK